jgi:hypothetical protein
MRLQNGGGPVWGGATWSEEGVGAGGRQDADAAEAVAGRTPTARSRGAEGGGGARGPHLENWGRPGRRTMGRARRNSESFDLFKQFSNKFNLF